MPTSGGDQLPAQCGHDQQLSMDATMASPDRRLSNWLIRAALIALIVSSLLRLNAIRVDSPGFHTAGVAVLVFSMVVFVMALGFATSADVDCSRAVPEGAFRAEGDGVDEGLPPIRLTPWSALVPRSPASSERGLEGTEQVPLDRSQLAAGYVRAARPAGVARTWRTRRSAWSGRRVTRPARSISSTRRVVTVLSMTRQWGNASWEDGSPPRPPALTCRRPAAVGGAV